MKRRRKRVGKGWALFGALVSIVLLNLPLAGQAGTVDDLKTEIQILQDRLNALEEKLSRQEAAQKAAAAEIEAAEVEKEDAGVKQLLKTDKWDISGSIMACFGMTQYLNFVDGPNGKALDSEFDATREMKLKVGYTANQYLKGIVSFQLGEGSTGGYFGSADAPVGGEVDGDLSVELDNLYLDITVPNTEINVKIGSQGARLPDAVYGSNLMYETPAGVVVSAPLTETVGIKASWFRLADMMDDSIGNMDDQADLFFLEVPVKMQGFQITPFGGYANIQDDLIRNSWTDALANNPADPGTGFGRYAYFNYPELLRETLGLGATPVNYTPTMPEDNVGAYYIGAGITVNYFDPLRIRATGIYGNMDWETPAVDVTIAGYFTDLVIDYKMDHFTPEVFGFYGSGPDANDDDLDMMPPLIGGPTYTSSFFGGSRYNDNMFDSYDAVYATSMWAIGGKLKDIWIGEKLNNELQLMYAQGTADDVLFEAPYDMLLNDDESFIEFNFNSTYQLMKQLVVATEFGYIVFDEDDDYNEALNGEVKDFWKAAFSLELYF